MHQPSEHEMLLTRALDLGEQMLLAGAISAGIILVSTVMHAYYAARGKGPGQP